MSAGWYFVLWRIPGQEPRGSQTFNTLRAVRSYARRALYMHPSWSAEIVEYADGEQVVVERKEAR